MKDTSKSKSFPRVIFSIAPLELEARKLFNSKNKLQDPAIFRSNSVFRIPFDKEIIHKIINSSKFEEAKPALLSYLNNYVPEKIIDVSKLQKAWDNTSNLFFSEIKKLTEKDFRFKRYDCYLVFSHVGHYEEGTNKVYSSSDMDIRRTIIICMEEILHLHYWAIVKGLLGVENVAEFNRSTNGLSWKISEVIPDYLLVENFSFKASGLFVDENRARCYPWIPEIRKILDPIWKNRKSFEDFVVKAHKATKCIS